MPKLTRVRDCDGKCCAESPRFPDGHGDCVYHTDGGCELMRDHNKIPEGKEDLFIITCLQFPEFLPAGRGTAGCCLQWVENGN